MGTSTDSADGAARRLHLESGRLPWAPVSAGVTRRVFAEPGGADRYATSLVRMEAGAEFAPPAPELGREVFVLEGEWSPAADGEPLEAGSYSYLPAGRVRPSTSPGGCLLFVKDGPGGAQDQDPVLLPRAELSWVPGHGNLSVQPLHSSGVTGTALVHWPAGERFLPHTHYGGEEIFVLSGTFLDEHGRYPAGSWLQSPHMSSHHPFVEEETVIYVKTGHLGDPV